jgi:hypothetical protein
LKPREQQASLWRIDSRKRLFDVTLGDRRQQARFGSVVPQAVRLITEIQARSFHGFVHRTVLTAGVGSDNAEHIRGEARERCCVVSFFFAARR